jgi:hypothetical protein
MPASDSPTTFLGPLSCAAVEAAFHARWPGLRLVLFVADHPYWKEHEGRLEPAALALRADHVVVMTGDMTIGRARARFDGSGLAAEIYTDRQENVSDDLSLDQACAVARRSSPDGPV